MVIAIYTGLAYIAVIVALYAGWCRPFSDYLVLVPTNSTSRTSVTSVLELTYQFNASHGRTTTHYNLP